MSSFNKVILMGNLTRDPEMRYTPSGMAIAKIGLAVNRKWYNEARELQEEVTFIDVDAFGKRAETIGQYLKKGRPIFVEGRLRLDQWEDKQTGQKRSRLGVVLENFQFLDSGQSREGGSPPSPRRASADIEPQRPPSNQLPPSTQPQRFHQPPNQPPPTDSGPPPEEDDDVPF